MLFLAISVASAAEIDNANNQFNDFNILGDNSILQSEGNDLDYSQNDDGVLIFEDNLEEKKSLDNGGELNSINGTGDINSTNTTEELNSTNTTGEINSTNGTGNINSTNKTKVTQNVNKTTKKTSSPKINFATKGTVTLTQVKIVAANLKNYIAKYSKLPNYITIGKYKISVSQFTYLMACAIKNIKAKHTSYKINIIPINVSEVNGNFIIKKVYSTAYLKWANIIISNGKKNKKINSYISLDSRKLEFKDYTNTFAIILNYYKLKKRLPKYITVETFVSTKYPKTLLGFNSLGKVELIGPFGNKSSKVKIAYSIGLHIREYQAHSALYHILNAKGSSLKYCYYVYKITLVKPTGYYSKDRMMGQKLAQKYTLPHASKQKYNLFIDIHSTVGKAYKYSYFVFVPGNKNKKAIKLAKTVVSKTKMVYYNPPYQTSPKYLTLPLVKKGTPTFVFETLTGESYKTTWSKINSLVKIVDKLFG